MICLNLILQHLVWILGLKPSSGGALKPGRAVEGPSTVSSNNFYSVSTSSNVYMLHLSLFFSQVLTTAVMTDLPVISNILSRLFESSQ